VAVFHLLGALAGAIVTFVLGVLGDALDASHHPDRYGTIMGTAVLISYIGCCPFFIWAGREYEKKMKSVN
jgi:hypothetical protein